MRFVRTSMLALLAVLLLVLGLSASAGAATPAPTTYKVLVGAESAQRGLDVMAFFPHDISVHVGDTVHWVQNSNEIHTVTFLGGQPIPEIIVPAASLNLPDTPSPLVFNPVAVDMTAPADGLGDTTTYVNSGLMGREPGQARSFDLTFSATGTYHYVCIVHGQMMTGDVHVAAASTQILSPGQAAARGRHQIARQFAEAPGVFRAAKAEIKPAVTNADGTMTHFIAMGFGIGQIDFLRFFPRRVLVHPGDTVVWEMTASNDAPHTVTFLNGAEEPGLVVPVEQQNGPPVLYVDPATLLPSQPAPTLLRAGLYNSGLMLPMPGSSFSMEVGDITAGPLPYLCLLHDTSGMKGTLVVLPPEG